MADGSDWLEGTVKVKLGGDGGKPPYGFIACDAVMQQYHRDAFLLAEQVEHLEVGDQVRFTAAADPRGKVLVKELEKLSADGVTYIPIQTERAPSGPGRLGQHRGPPVAPPMQAQHGQLALPASPFPHAGAEQVASALVHLAPLSGLLAAGRVAEAAELCLGGLTVIAEQWGPAQSAELRGAVHGWSQRGGGAPPRFAQAQPPVRFQPYSQPAPAVRAFVAPPLPSVTFRGKGKGRIAGKGKGGGGGEPGGGLENHEMDDVWYQGTVKKKGSEPGAYGFATAPDLVAKYGRDAFLHSSQLEGLNIGDEVTFQVSCDPATRKVCVREIQPGWGGAGAQLS